AIVAIVAIDAIGAIGGVGVRNSCILHPSTGRGDDLRPVPSSMTVAALPSHGVRFYAGDDELADAVADYLAHGARAGDALVVAATPEHAARFRERLAALLGRDAHDDVEFHDADAMLARFFDGARIDRRAARDALIALLRRDDGRPVRAFGEMVDLLWRR